MAKAKKTVRRATAQQLPAAPHHPSTFNLILMVAMVAIVAILALLILTRRMAP